MKVLNARVKTWFGTYRPHHLEILVDALPKDKLYEKADHGDGTACYYSETDGMVSFFYHNPKNQAGYAGSAFTLNMVDGSEVRIVGPWSSNAQHMETHSGILAMDVSLTADPAVFERGYTFYGAQVTEEIARQAMVFVEPEWQLIQAGGVHGGEDFSSEQAAILYQGVIRGWYIARENCPINRKTEEYLWPEVQNLSRFHPKQTVQRRRTEELDPTLCLTGWHYDKKLSTGRA